MTRRIDKGPVGIIRSANRLWPHNRYRESLRHDKIQVAGNPIQHHVTLWEDQKCLEIYSRLITRKFIAARYMASRNDEKGASAVEYGLLVALIAAVIILAVVALGDTLEGVFTDTNTTIEGNTP